MNPNQYSMESIRPGFFRVFFILPDQWEPVFVFDSIIFVMEQKREVFQNPWS